MGMSWRYDAEANIVYSEGTGELSADEMLEYLAAVLADERIQPGFLEVTSLEDAELQLSYEKSQLFPEMWRRYNAKGSRGSIILAPTDVTFGMLRMVQAVIDQGDQGTRFIVVRTREEFDARIAELRAP